MWPFKKKNYYKMDYKADGFATKKQAIGFMNSTAFKEAWDISSEFSKIGWPEGVPDIRWRTHVAIWAAQNALRIEGDFVECGVHTGILSLSICEFLKFGELKDRKFWLFDTWEGIPTSQLTETEKEIAERYNSTIYKDDIYSPVEKKFSKFPNVRMVKGILPDSFSKAQIDKIAYLSVDLNNAAPEKAAIEYLWPKLSKGALVVIDDYGWNEHQAQREMWDEFATSQNRFILTLPTGQGLLMK